MFFDEERYYRVCICLDEKEPFSIEKQDKKILIKNVFLKGKKREAMQRVEQRLEELGFENEGTSVKVKGGASVCLKTNKSLPLPNMHRFFQKQTNLPPVHYREKYFLLIHLPRCKENRRQWKLHYQGDGCKKKRRTELLYCGWRNPSCKLLRTGNGRYIITAVTSAKIINSKTRSIFQFFRFKLILLL